MARLADSVKQQQWLERIRRWQASRLTVRAFCERQGLSEPSFYTWRRTLRERGLLTDVAGTVSQRDGVEGDSALPRFVPVQLTQQPSVCLELVVDEVVVRVPAGFDAATLQRLLEVLEARPC